jgi:hypothetical protein
MLPAGGDTYSGTFTAPPNYTESPVSYGITIQATDTNGQYAETGAEVEVAAQPQFDQAPYVSNSTVTPRAVPATGGSVTIGAAASDDRAISEVFATVTSPGRETTYIQMQGTSSSTYEGVFDVPDNTGATPVEYHVVVTAYDDIGQEANEDAGTFTVAAKPAPPAAKLKAWPDAASFGRVAVGHRAYRLVTIRNTGPKGSAPVSGTVTVSGPGFTLVGGRSGPIAFRLRAGEIKAYIVEFRPASAGLKQGAVTFHRSDGGQPDLTVALSGQGTVRRR